MIWVKYKDFYQYITIAPRDRIWFQTKQYNSWIQEYKGHLLTGAFLSATMKAAN